MSHLKLHHKKAVTDDQIDALADISLQLIGPLFEACPFCGTEEQDDKESLQEHIAGHLQSLALRSLPPLKNGNEETNDITGSDEMDYEMSAGKEANPQTNNQGITAFLNPASVSVPEARLAIKYQCHSGKNTVAGPELSPSQKTPGQNSLIYVVQQPEDVDYTIDIPLEEPFSHSKITNIKCQIVYDPGSDDCILINRTRDDLVLFKHQHPETFHILRIDGISTIQPGVWGIKLHSADSTIENSCPVKIWLRERRYTIAIAQLNDALRIQEVEDAKRQTKRQKRNANSTTDVVRHASSSTIDWELDAKNNNADSSFFDMQDGNFATIHAPLSTTDFQKGYSPARYKIKRINTISDDSTSKMFCCEHSFFTGRLVLKVLQYKDKSPRDLIKLSELWQHEKSMLSRLNHVRLTFYHYVLVELYNNLFCAAKYCVTQGFRWSYACIILRVSASFYSSRSRLPVRTI